MKVGIDNKCEKLEKENKILGEKIKELSLTIKKEKEEKELIDQEMQKIKQEQTYKEKEVNMLKKEVGTYEAKLDNSLADAAIKERTIIHLCQNLDDVKNVNKKLEIQLISNKGRKDDAYDNVPDENDNLNDNEGKKEKEIRAENEKSDTRKSDTRKTMKKDINNKRNLRENKNKRKIATKMP